MRPKFGICGPFYNHTQGADIARAFTFMKESNLVEYRIDIPLAEDSFAKSVKSFERLKLFAETFGIKLRPILSTSFTWHDATDGKRHPRGDLYAQGFVRTFDFVSRFPDIEHWELNNEINLKYSDAQGKLYGRGQTAAEWNVPLMRQWADVLRGTTDAIDYLSRLNGRKYRKTLGTTSTMFGFLDFMKDQGVTFNAISTHYYDKPENNPHQHWNGKLPPYDMFAKFDSYNMPITVNEFNAQEIYNEPMDEEKAKYGLKKNLSYFLDGTFKNLESILFYSLIDDPKQPSPENRFGTFTPDWRPKWSTDIIKTVALDTVPQAV